MANFKTRTLRSYSEQKNKQLHVNKPTVKRGTFLPPIVGNNLTSVHTTRKYFHHKDSLNTYNLVGGRSCERKKVRTEEYKDAANYFSTKINSAIYKAYATEQLPVFMMRKADTKKNMTRSELRFRSSKLSRQLQTENSQKPRGENVVSKEQPRTLAVNDTVPEYSDAVGSNVNIQIPDQAENNVHLKRNHRQNSFHQSINGEVSSHSHGSPDLSQTTSFQNVREFNDFDSHNVLNAEMEESRTEYQQDLCRAMKNDKDAIQLSFVTTSQKPYSSDYELNEQCSVNEVIEPTPGPSPKLWDKTSEWKRKNELKWANKNMFGEDVFTEHGTVKIPIPQLKNYGSNVKRRTMKTWGELSQMVSDEEYITTAIPVSEFQVTCVSKFFHS